jgi:ADP-ribose pyrophosphatase
MKYNQENFQVFSSISISAEGDHLIFPESAAILGLFNDGTVLLVEQLRKIVNKKTIELPGGKVNVGESVEDAIKRELLEETGYHCTNVKPIFTLDMDFSVSVHRTHVFTGTLTQKDAPTENFKNHIVSIVQLMKLISEGKITHAPTVAAAYWLLNERK